MVGDIPAASDRTAARSRADQIEEARAVGMAALGDEGAVAWLLAKYRDRAVRLACATMRRPSEAEDAAQEAFIRAFRSIGSLRDRSNFGSWLFQIVVRTCLNRMKASRWKMEISSDELLLRQPDRGRQPGVTGDAMLVQELLGLLSPPLRAALVLREMEGLDYDEIARALGVPVGTVRSRLSAARERFRQLWLQAEKEANDV